MSAVENACDGAQICGGSTLWCPAFVACAEQVLSGMPATVAGVCELDALTDCCVGSHACPGSCAVHGHVVETVFGPSGAPQELQRCVCDDCGLEFPDGYPVDVLTW